MLLFQSKISRSFTKQIVCRPAGGQSVYKKAVEKQGKKGFANFGEVLYTMRTGVVYDTQDNREKEGYVSWHY